MSLAFPRPRFLAVLALSTALAGPAAWAQTSSYDTGSDPVSVDLSVIDDAGRGGGLPPAAAPSYGHDLGSGENLRVPGARAPVSQLHVQVPGGRSSSPAARAARSTPAPAPAPAAVPRKEVATAPAEPKAEAPAPSKMPETAPKKPDSAPARLEPEAKTPPAPEKKPAETAAKETVPAPPPEPAPTASTSASEQSAPPPAPEAAPAPEPAAKPASPEPQTAATDATGNGQGSLRLDFAADETKLPGNAAADLGKLAEQLAAKEDLRVQLLAYAGGDELSASKARRISLSRALSVRSFLIDKGVRSTRIDVRALGDKTDEEPKNRVDVEVVER